MYKNESPIRVLKKRTISSPLIEVSSQASEDVSYAFPGDESPLAGAKRLKQQKSLLANRFNQISTPKNKEMKRFQSSPLLHPNSQNPGAGEKRGFHKFQEELARLKEQPATSSETSLYLTSKETQQNTEGDNSNSNMIDEFDQFYNDSADAALILCTQQADAAEIQKNTKVIPQSKAKLATSIIPSTTLQKASNDTNNSTITSKMPASDSKPVINNDTDYFFDDSFSDLLSKIPIDDIIQQAGKKSSEVPAKSTPLSSKPTLPSTTTLASVSNTSNAFNNGFPRHVSMPVKKIDAPIKSACSKINNNGLERHTSLNFNQQITTPNNIKNYNSTESVQSSGFSSTRTPPEHTRKCTPQEIEEKRQRALKLQESRRLERMRNLNQQNKK